MLCNVAVYLLLEIESSESDVARNKSVGCCTRSSLLIGVARRSPFAVRYSLLRSKLHRTERVLRVLNYEIGFHLLCNFIRFETAQCGTERSRVIFFTCNNVILKISVVDCCQAELGNAPSNNHDFVLLIL